MVFKLQVIPKIFTVIGKMKMVSIEVKAQIEFDITLVTREVKV